jgi:hypothetical protein
VELWQAWAEDGFSEERLQPRHGPPGWPRGRAHDCATHAKRGASLEHYVQPWRGLIQRAMMLPFIVWLFAFGLVLLKRGSPSPRHLDSSLTEGNLDLHLSGSAEKS